MITLYTSPQRYFTLLFALLLCTTITSATTPIAYGDNVTASIEAEGEKDQYTFNGTAGDRIWIRMRDADSPIDACLQLWSPSNVLLGEHCRDGGIVRLKGVDLTESGTYTIIASDNRDNDTGAYGLSLEILNSPIAASPIDCGADWTEALQGVVEVQAYSFEAQAGEVALVRMRSSNTSMESELSLYDPEGNLLATQHSSHLSEIGPLALPSSGTYQIMVTDYNGNDIGAYGISFQLINRLDCSPTLACGDESSVFGNNGGVLDFSINHLAEVDAFHFNASPGDVLVVQMYSPIKGFEVSLQLYDRAGNLLAFPTPSYGLVRLEYDAFTDDDAYILLVADNNGNDLGTYGLFLEKVNDGGCGNALNCGDHTEVNELKEYGYMKSFRFVAEANSNFSALVRPHDQAGLDPRLELFSPNGVNIFDEESYGSVSIDSLTLPESGTYTILVSDANGNDLGGFDLALETDAVVDQEAPNLVCQDVSDKFYLENGSLTIDPSVFIASATDNCGELTISTDIATFTCEHIGENWMTIQAQDNSGNTASCTVPVYIEDLEGHCVQNYCEAKGTSTAYEWIEKVAFAGLGNSSGNDNGYGDFTSNNISLYRNAEYGLYLTPGIEGNSGNRYWGVWIDWNRDGDFDDEGETILKDKSKNLTKTTFFTPMSAPESAVQMRVIYQYGDSPNACGTFEYGEVEDYLLTVLTDPVCEELPNDWYASNIGNNPIPGSVCYQSENETFTVSGSGADIYSTEDEFFFVYTSLCGDGDIVVQLSDMGKLENYNPMSGIMLRKTTKAGAKNVSLLASNSGEIYYQARENNNGGTIYEAHEGEAPIWLKLTRRGNWFTGYLSKDGEEWELVCPFEMSMPNCLEIGMAVTSNDPNNVNQSVFKNVAVLPVAISNDIDAETEELAPTRSVEDTPNTNAELSAVRIFPNPIQDYATVECPECKDQTTSLRLYNLTGSLVWEKEVQATTDLISCDFSHLALPTGTYSLSLQTRTKSSVHKIVIQSNP